LTPPPFLQALVNLAQSYYSDFRRNASNLAEAAALYERVLSLQPTLSSAIYNLMRARTDAADWRDDDDMSDRLVAALRRDLNSSSLMVPTLDSVDLTSPSFRYLFYLFFAL
jgi:hypothetical protein